MGKGQIFGKEKDFACARVLEIFGQQRKSSRITILLAPKVALANQLLEKDHREGIEHFTCRKKR
jgi:hypothetical protein